MTNKTFNNIARVKKKKNWKFLNFVQQENQSF